jgi:hypothetical protein
MSFVPTVRTYAGITGVVIPKDANGKQLIPLTPAAHKFALQVSTPSGVITSWSVTLEGSIDGVNWTILITHAANIGTTQWAVDKPVSFVRVNVGAVSLGTAPSIAVGLIAYP